MGNFPGDPGWNSEEKIRNDTKELIRAAQENARRLDINMELNRIENNIRRAEEALEGIRYEFNKLKEMYV